MAVQWAFTFGILGNIVSFLVYLAPLPTFIRIFKEKSTMGFDSLPYVVALFSSMLWMYYAFLKKNAFLLITINSFGCFIETIYILLYLFYASKRAKTRTVKLVGLMNMGLFCGIFMLTFFKFDGHIRIQVVGWICVVISVCVFVAPMSIVFQVVRTRSVEFMPFTLSFFLTLSAVMWFAYGLFQRDICIAIPNILGFFLGMIQMVLYAIFRNKKKKKKNEIIIKEDEKMAEQVINVTILGTPDGPEKSCGNSKIEAINELEESSNNYVPCALSVEPSQVNLQQLESPILVVCAAA